jgi:hypothetical protein
MSLFNLQQKEENADCVFIAFRYRDIVIVAFTACPAGRTQRNAFNYLVAVELKSCI